MLHFEHAWGDGCQNQNWSNESVTNGCFASKAYEPWNKNDEKNKKALYVCVSGDYQQEWGKEDIINNMQDTLTVWKELLGRRTAH